MKNVWLFLSMFLFVPWQQMRADGGKVYPFECEYENGFYIYTADIGHARIDSTSLIVITAVSVMGRAETSVTLLLELSELNKGGVVPELCNRILTYENGLRKGLFNGAVYLSNGEILRGTINAINNRNDAIPESDMIGAAALVLNFIDFSSSTRADLQSMDKWKRHNYVMSRLATYDIVSIKFDKYSFSFKAFPLAPTVHAMLTQLKTKVSTYEWYTEDAPAPSAPVAPLVESPSEQPSFPGGPLAMMNYIAEHLSYPEGAQEDGIQGRVVVEFVVEADGSLSQPKVLRGVDARLDAEAVRVVGGMPRWKPGRLDGKPVRVRYTVPVMFRLK